MANFFKKNPIVIFLFLILLISFNPIFLGITANNGYNNYSDHPLKPQGTLNKVDSLSAPKYLTELAWDGDHLWLAENDQDKIYKMNPSNGDLLQSFDAPGNEPSGLTWDGESLWCAEWEEAMIYKLDPSSGSIIESFEAPEDQPTGLAWDGRYLWNADNALGKIFKIDPSSGELIDSFDSPRIDPKGLTWDGQDLLVSITSEKKIYRIDHSNGMIVADFKGTAENNHGLAWDGQYIWESDHSNAVIYKLLIQDQEKPTWDEPPTNQTLNIGESFSYDLNASDNNEIEQYWINETENFEIDSDGILTNTNQLSVGNYWLEIRAYDPSGNYVSKTIKITIKSNKIPGFKLSTIIAIFSISIVILLIRNRKSSCNKKNN
jgi:DNA-binding beta-propeller fold protein YncE